MKRPSIRIGMRTLKTVLAVVLSMLAVNTVGTTDSRLIFAMIGATAAMQPTIKESIDSCIAQVVGVLFGAAAGLFLRHLPLPALVNTGIGIALCIVLYNTLRISYSPSLPIFMVVLLCTTPDIEAIPYAAGRVWDSAIGLGIGMLINVLIFPYDNSRTVRTLVQQMNRESLLFLEKMFGGSGTLPEAEDMRSQITALAAQMQILSNQRPYLRAGKKQTQLTAYRQCEEMARQMLAQMEVLRHIGVVGCLSEENRQRLIEQGASLSEEGSAAGFCADPTLSLVTNYHVARILELRTAMCSALGE